MSILLKKIRPSSRKVALSEWSFGQKQKIFFNFSPGVYYVMFSAIYPLIDASFLNGVTAQNISDVGSVSSNAAACLKVNSVATVEAVELSFYSDPALRGLWFHLQNGDPPSLHRVVIGVVFGAANRPGVWGTTYYAPRIDSAPALVKRRDPLSFGPIAYPSFSVTLKNDPDPRRSAGPFDDLPRKRYVYGSRIRSLVGFDDDQYADFSVAATGFVNRVRLGQQKLTIGAEDIRRVFDKKVPINFFKVADYPNLDPKNEGKVIPLGYGVVIRQKVTCTNEKQASPVSYSFKICDMSFHSSIHAITAVYVDGVAKTPTATSLADATFTLSTSDYSPGKTVTVDYSGYRDNVAGTLIENSLDVIKDMMVNLLKIPFLPETYDIPLWLALRAAVPNVGFCVDAEKQASELIETICRGALIFMDTHPDGRYVPKRCVQNPATRLKLKASDLLRASEIELDIDTSKIISMARIGHSRDWSTGQSQYYTFDEFATQVKELYGESVDDYETFETFLRSEADARACAIGIMSVAAKEQIKFTARTKMQALGIELGDAIEVPLYRQTGQGFVGMVKAEVIGVPLNLDDMEIPLECRIIEFIPETIYVQGAYWGRRWWGYRWWQVTGEQEKTA